MVVVVMVVGKVTVVGKVMAEDMPGDKVKAADTVVDMAAGIEVDMAAGIEVDMAAGIEVDMVVEDTVVNMAAGVWELRF